MTVIAVPKKERHCSGCRCFDPLSDPDEDALGQMHKDAQRTERLAATKLFPRSGTQRRAVLDYYASIGPEGACDVVGARESGIYQQAFQARRHELMKGGWLVDTGTEQDTGNGGTGIRWAMSPAGLRKYRRREDM